MTISFHLWVELATDRGVESPLCRLLSLVSKASEKMVLLTLRGLHLCVVSPGFLPSGCSCLSTHVAKIKMALSVLIIGIVK